MNGFLHASEEPPLPGRHVTDRQMRMYVKTRHGSQEHLADLPAVGIARTEPVGADLAVSEIELALQLHLRDLRRNCRCHWNGFELLTGIGGAWQGHWRLGIAGLTDI